MPSNFIKESLLNLHCPLTSKLFDAEISTRDRVVSFSPPRSPSRKDHSGPRRLTESSKPFNSPRPFNVDCIGTEIDAESLKRRRLVGPPTILDIRTELCGRHLVIPHYFRYVFSHLNESTGSIRFSPREGTDAASECKIGTNSDSAYGHDKVGVDGSSRCGSEEVEVSLLGAVFVLVVGAAFVTNIASARS